MGTEAPKHGGKTKVWQTPESRTRQQVSLLNRICKTSIPGSNPGGASKFLKNCSSVSDSRPSDVTSFVPTWGVESGRRRVPIHGSKNALPETGVTVHSGDMGDTSPPRRGHALEGVSRGRRASSVRCPPARRRDDDGAVRGVRDLPEDRLQDLRPLQRGRPAGADGSQPAAVPARQPAAAGDREDDRAAETGVSELGRAEDSGAAAAALPGRAVPRHQHGPRRARSPRPGDARGSAGGIAPRARRSRTRPSRTTSGAPTTRGSSCSPTGAIAIRSPSPTSPAAI